MATINPRLNITLSEESLSILSSMSKAEGKSMSAIAREFIENMLEYEDDAYYVKLSESRKNEPTISHEEVMKKYGLDD